MSSFTAGPTNNLVSALLTDTYQITMSYAHWKTGKHNDPATFELFFRKNPFQGEFTIFCGLEEVLKHLTTFAFTQQDIDYLKTTPALQNCEDAFFDFLLQLDTSQLTAVYAMKEGSIVFPRIPLLILQGPIVLGQLLETTLLNLINFPSLVATNAARMVLRAQPSPCVEFGLRRAQGPDGGCSASKYSYMGGFVATSNVQAGKLYGIPITGTHAHAYVQAFSSLEEVETLELWNHHTAKSERFLNQVLKYVTTTTTTTTNKGELAAFVAYACSFPNSCLCLIDTYDTLQSGLPNFLAVAQALVDFGYTPKGIRLDSGDLAKLSLECSKAFQCIQQQQQQQQQQQNASSSSSSSAAAAAAAAKIEAFGKLSIVVSNDVNEQILYELSQQPHAISSYGIGTHLVTCQTQPALGCVYKIVEWKGKPRIKISQDIAKVTIPGRKRVFRLFGIRQPQKGHDENATISKNNNNNNSGNDLYTPLVDLMILEHEPIPVVGTRVTCRNPFELQDRFQVIPSRVEELHSKVFSNGKVSDELQMHPPTLEESRAFVQSQLQTLSPDILRYVNPRPYPTMVSTTLFQYLHELWEREAPMEEKR